MWAFLSDVEYIFQQNCPFPFFLSWYLYYYPIFSFRYFYICFCCCCDKVTDTSCLNKQDLCWPRLGGTVRHGRKIDSSTMRLLIIPHQHTGSRQKWLLLLNLFSPSGIVWESSLWIAAGWILHCQLKLEMPIQQTQPEVVSVPLWFLSTIRLSTMIGHYIL